MRVLLVQRTIEPPGGGNAVAAWMLQALAHRHDVYTLTEKPWDARLARYGRRFSSERFIGELNAIVERFTSTPST